MKKTMISLFLLVAGMMQAQQRQALVSCRIDGLKDSCMVRVTDGEGYRNKFDIKEKSTEGKVDVCVEANLPRMANVTIFGKNKRSKSRAEGWTKLKTFRVMLDETPLQIHLNVGQLEDEHSQAGAVKGGKAQQQYSEYQSFMRPYEHKADSLGMAEAMAWFAHNGEEDSILDLKNANLAAKAEVARMNDVFIADHPDYIVSAALLAQKPFNAFTYTNRDFDRLYEALKNNPDTMHMNFINRNLDRIHRFGLGARFADFEGKGTDGKMVRLSSLMEKGKMTLVDLWASWCGPCRAAIPKVKALKEKYGDKLHVVSCSVDENEANWRKAEAQEKMPWPQMLVLKDEQNKILGPYYALSSIPRLVLIDADGKIVCVTHDPMIIKDKLK